MKNKIDLTKIPVYEITIEDDSIEGIRNISIVSDPAIGVMGMYFSENSKDEMEFKFKAEGHKQIIVGPAMIPNKRILRKDANGMPYYCFFSEDTISRMVSKFNRDNNNRSINVDHKNINVNGYIMEDWIIEDSIYDKSRYYGFNNLPKGTYFIVVKIEDPVFWKNDVIDMGKYGFSIEGLMAQELTDFNSVEESLIITDEDIDSILKEVFPSLFY